MSCLLRVQDCNVSLFVNMNIIVDIIKPSNAIKRVYCLSYYKDYDLCIVNRA